jgi:salicylate hydroxylase
MPEDRDSRGPEDQARPHCLIAGAGIGGLTVALFLERAGWQVTLADREPVLEEIGAGIQLAPNATRLLDEIGILGALDDIAVEPFALNIRRGRDGASLGRATLGKSAEARFGAPFLVVHRGELQAALRRKAEAARGITFRLGLTLTDIREGESTITALFADADGATTRIEADLLIGADGLWSRARSLAGLPAPMRYAGKTAWRALIPRDTAPLHAREAEVNLWLGPDAHIVHYPVSGGDEINIVAIIEDDWREPGWSAEGETDVIRARFRDWHPKARDLINAAEDWHRWALVDRAPETRWSRARMTLLGDAAHPMMPFLAQGASQAIEDAAALAALLPPTRDATAIAEALKRYDLVRIPRTARIQRESRRQGRIYHFDGLRAKLRDTALKLMPGDALLARYAWLYGHHSRKAGF